MGHKKQMGRGSGEKEIGEGTMNKEERRRDKPKGKQERKIVGATRDRKWALNTRLGGQWGTMGSILSR